MSLSNLLDIHQPQDLLRGLINTLTEYDQSKEDSDKPKMVCTTTSNEHSTEHIGSALPSDSLGLRTANAQVVDFQSTRDMEMLMHPI